MPPVPQIEVVSSPGPGTPPAPPDRGRLSRRLWVFLGVFLGCLALGEAVNFLRPAVYRASASLLTVAPPPVDAGDIKPMAPNVQHVAVQRELMLGQPVLEATLKRLREDGDAGRFKITAVADFQPLLEVVDVVGTNLVKLQATGDAPELLARLVNAWIEAYTAFREAAVKEDLGDTLERLRGRQEELRHTLEAKRAELAAFREKYGIVSEGRSENRILNRLKGVNADLNKAKAEQVAARAALETLSEAVARGERVIPKDEKPALLALEARAEKLREKLAAFEKKYTAQYRFVNPEFQALPGRLDEVQKAIDRKLKEGRRLMLEQARRRLRAANERVARLETELDLQQQDAAAFSARFKQYQTLNEDLKELEKLQREVEARLAALKAKRIERYPQLKVVDWAAVPTEPLYPDYRRDALIVLLGSFVLGLLAVWLAEFLQRPPDLGGRPAGNVTGVRVYAAGAALGQVPPPPPLEGTARPTLDSAPSTALPAVGDVAAGEPERRRLRPAQVAALWRLADDPLREWLGLLLAGATAEEALALDADAFDLEAGEVHLPDGRRLWPPEAAWVLYREQRPLPLWAGEPQHPEDWEARLHVAGVDAGLGAVEAAELRAAYIHYLVGQGVRLGELPRILGPIAPRTLAAYAAFSPEGPGRPLEEVDLRYPLNVA